MEHVPWIGAEYSNGSGIEGQKIAIVGFSHYSDNLDSATYTKDLIKSCISSPSEDFNGDMGSFNVVPSYFSFHNKSMFWPKVCSLTFCLL